MRSFFLQYSSNLEKNILEQIMLVNKNLKAFALMVVNTSRQIGWMSEYGEQLDLPLNGQEEAICTNTKQRYRLNGKQLERTNT